MIKDLDETESFQDDEIIDTKTNILDHQPKILNNQTIFIDLTGDNDEPEDKDEPEDDYIIVHLKTKNDVPDLEDLNKNLAKHGDFEVLLENGALYFRFKKSKKNN